MTSLDYLSLMLIFHELDLRDDKQFFIDHPGAVPISTAQVNDRLNWSFIFKLFFPCVYNLVFDVNVKGEELRKLIGAPAYIECSSKTQQVFVFVCEWLGIVVYGLLIWFWTWCNHRMWREFLMQQLGLYFNLQSRRKRRAKLRKHARYYERNSSCENMTPSFVCLYSLIFSFLFFFFFFYLSFWFCSSLKVWFIFLSRNTRNLCEASTGSLLLLSWKRRGIELKDKMFLTFISLWF